MALTNVFQTPTNRIWTFDESPDDPVIEGILPGDTVIVTNVGSYYMDVNHALQTLAVNSIQTATVTLTNAQIKALPTTPVEIIAAPGAGKLIVPLMGVLHTNSTWIADYGNIEAGDQLQLRYNTQIGAALPLKNAIASAVAAVLAGGGPDGTVALMPPYFVAGVDLATGFSGLNNVYDSDVVNKAIKLHSVNSSDYTGGNASNTLQVTVIYFVVDLSN